MASITGYTGIIEVDGIWFIVEDGHAYYFDDTASETPKDEALKWR